MHLLLEENPQVQPQVALIQCLVLEVQANSPQLEPRVSVSEQSNNEFKPFHENKNKMYVEWLLFMMNKMDMNY